MFQATCNSAAIELISDLKEKAIELRELLGRIGMHVDEQHQHALSTEDIDEMQRLQDADPFRWYADARYSLQAGVMFALRAVEQPAMF